LCLALGDLISPLKTGKSDPAPVQRRPGGGVGAGTGGNDSIGPLPCPAVSVAGDLDLVEQRQQLRVVPA